MAVRSDEYECCDYCMWLGKVNKNGTIRKHFRASDDLYAAKKVQVKELGVCPGSNKPFARFGTVGEK